MRKKDIQEGKIYWMSYRGNNQKRVKVIVRKVYQVPELCKFGNIMRNEIQTYFRVQNLLSGRVIILRTGNRLIEPVTQE